MLSAIPAIAAALAGGVAALLVFVARPDAARLSERYEREADRALAVGDGATARLCAQRLIQLDPSNPDHRERLLVANSLPQ